MGNIWAQVVKEWNTFKRDRLGLSLAFLLPLATLLLFGYGVRLQNQNIPVIVENQPKSSIAKSIIDEMTSSKLITVLKNAQQGDPLSALVNNQAKAVIIIPDKMNENVQSGKVSQFQILIDGSDVSAAETLSALARTVSFEVEHTDGPRDLHSKFVIPDFKIWFNPDVKEAPFVVSGVFAIVLWMYPALLAAVAISREMEQETIIQIYASGLTPAQFLVGKGAVYFAVGLVVAAFMMILSALLFDLHFAGDPSAMILSTIIYVIASVSFGLLVGVATKEENIAVQATATGGFFPALLLSGFVYPLSNIAFPLSLFSYVVPARYYIEICRDAYMKAMGLEEMWWRMLILVLFATLAFISAWTIIRRMQVED